MNAQITAAEARARVSEARARVNRGVLAVCSAAAVLGLGLLLLGASPGAVFDVLFVCAVPVSIAWRMLMLTTAQTGRELRSFADDDLVPARNPLFGSRHRDRASSSPGMRRSACSRRRS